LIFVDFTITCNHLSAYVQFFVRCYVALIKRQFLQRVV